MRKLLFFHANWCEPCKFYSKQFIDEIEKKTGNVERVNAQENPFLADRYMVSRLPAVVLLDEEEKKKLIYGSLNIEEVVNWLNDSSNHRKRQG